MEKAEFKSKYIFDGDSELDSFKICLHQYFSNAKKCTQIAEQIKDGLCLDKESSCIAIETYIAALKCAIEYKSKLGDNLPIFDFHGDISVGGITIRKGVPVETDALKRANMLYASSKNAREVEVATYVISCSM